MIWLFWTFLNFAVAGNNPLLSESKVQADLDAVLSKVIPKDKYLVQVQTDIGTRQEKKLIEDETIVKNPEDIEPEDQETLPGFIPEVKEVEPKKPIRQVYRYFDVPVLNAVKVQVTLDEAISAPILALAKNLVHQYLSQNYPNHSTVTFNFIPMLSTKPDRDVASIPEKNEKDQKPNWLTNLPWILFALLFGLVLYSIGKTAMSPARAAAAAAKGKGGTKTAPQPFPFFPIPPIGDLFQKGANLITGKEAKEKAEAEEIITKEKLRKIFLDRIFNRSQAFKLFYGRLSQGEKVDLSTGLKGPAYESFLEGIGIKAPKAEDPEPHDIDDRLKKIEKSFEEFIQAKEWHDKQFFGFMQIISDDQALALLNQEDAKTACVILRFMKPAQSAHVLERLPPEKRQEILGQVEKVQHANFMELAMIESRVRNEIDRMPPHFFSSSKEDANFWGSILMEADEQDSILEDLEKTNPGISPQLKKFKFKLEDAASLPDDLLGKVLADIDNDELAQAMAACSEDVAEVFLEAVTPKRREMLEAQIISFRSAPKNELQAARAKLTMKFRETVG